MRVTKSPPKKKRRGPPTKIGGERMNFFEGDCLAKLPALNDLYKKAGLPRISKAYALREGVRAWLKAKITETKTALSGELHAKRR